MQTCPCFFHREQLTFRPRYEWALGKRIKHPERTERADRILAALEADAHRFEVHAPTHQPLDEVAAQHYPELLQLYRTAQALPAGETFYPSVFLQNKALMLDTANLNHTGHFCFDSGTPLSRETCRAALWSAACALTAAQTLSADGHPLVYALSRPPGHHATEGLFGGYCYFNNAALAARHLRRFGRVAVLDIDAHHGNGTQSIFWHDPQVLTISMHAEPEVSFPFLVGYEAERGEGEGLGRNINIPLAENTDGQAFIGALEQRALSAITEFRPRFLVVAAGVDAYHLDPVGKLALTTEDFHRIGELIGHTGLPICAVQEGGYYTKHIGINVVALLHGMQNGIATRGVAVPSGSLGPLTSGTCDGPD